MSKVQACIIETENSIPNKFAKDQRAYKYDDLQFGIENPVDFESLRVNGFPELKDRFERQGLMYYFDVLNGPTYTELIKEFWMKASVITREKYNTNIRRLIKERPELQGKTPAEMGLRPFVSTEIESFVAGFRVSIRLAHIYEALKLLDDGLFIKSTDSAGQYVDEFIFKAKADPKDKLEMTNLCKVIYKIFIDSIIPKLGGTDQFSTVQKLFTFHVGKGNFVDVAKLLFIHLADSIVSSKPIIHHGRLLRHMFAQSGLLDAVKPFFPGYDTYMTSSKIINSTTLRYLHLVKAKQIVHPTHPLLIRESEENIAECRLVHVSDRDARIISEAHAEFLKGLGAEVGSGETEGLTVRQSRILEQPTRIFMKRKVVKSPAESGSKKAPKTKKNTVPRKARKPRAYKTLLVDLTEKEKDLENTYDCGIDPKVFDDMYSKLPPRNDPQSLTDQQTLYGPAYGKNPEYLGNSSAFRNVFQTLKHPPLIPVKRAFDRIFKGVNSKKDPTLSENQPMKFR
ncbi:hypothetical protein QL285_027489 [Trifolium repens]|nr:hypothetical protein QL285_027489 [Trifolium repens]